MEQFSPLPTMLEEMDEHTSNHTQEIDFYQNIDDIKEDKTYPDFADDGQCQMPPPLPSNMPPQSMDSPYIPSGLGGPQGQGGLQGQNRLQGQNGVYTGIMQSNCQLAEQCVDNLSDNVAAETYLSDCMLALAYRGDDAESTRSETQSEYSDQSERDGQSVPKLSRAEASALSEEQKKQRRKDLNREAATRSRAKKRTRQQELEEECKLLKKDNEEKGQIICKLEAERSKILAAVRSHFKKCPANTRQQTAPPNAGQRLPSMSQQMVMPRSTAPHGPCLQPDTRLNFRQ